MLRYYRKTHLAPLTTLFLSIQNAPGSSPADPLGCLYLSIQIESVFIYNYHIETHSPEWTLSPPPAVGSVFLYGRGARERSEFYWLKASYFTLKFHPRHLITLVTFHDRSPFKKIWFPEQESNL